MLRAHGLAAADRGHTSDPYVVVQCTSGARGKTSVKTATLEPEWDETFAMSIFDKDIVVLTLILTLTLTLTLTLALALTLTNEHL